MPTKLVSHQARRQGLLWMTVAYGAAVGVAVLTTLALYAWCPAAHPLWIAGAAAQRRLGAPHPLCIAAIADVAATLAVFAFSLALDNSSLYDPYWSMAPPLLGLYWIAAPIRAVPIRAVPIRAVPIRAVPIRTVPIRAVFIRAARCPYAAPSCSYWS